MSRTDWLLVILMCLSFCIFLESLIVPIIKFVAPSVEFGPREQTATLTLYPRDEETVVHFELSDVASPDSAPSLETVIQLCQGSDGVRLRVWPCIQTSRMDVNRSMMCDVRYKSTKSPLSQL